jgi:hypothetical protein
VLKLRRGIRNVPITAYVPEPRVLMERIDRKGRRAIFEASSVRIETRDGRPVSRRDDPRRYFPGGRRAFRWDELDEIYFSGYASWNYLTFPRLLLRDDIDWEMVAETTLEARFPDGFPTHSQVQRFHFDPETGLLRQHDYTAEVFGDWAAAANVVLKHREHDGIPYPSRRRVTPRRADGTPRRGPVLVDIRIRDWRLVP